MFKLNAYLPTYLPGELFELGKDLARLVYDYDLGEIPLGRLLMGGLRVGTYVFVRGGHDCLPREVFGGGIGVQVDGQTRFPYP